MLIFNVFTGFCMKTITNYFSFTKTIAIVKLLPSAAMLLVSSPVSVKSEQETGPGSLRCRFPAATRVMILNSKSFEESREVECRIYSKCVRAAECPADGVAACLGVCNAV